MSVGIRSSAVVCVTSFLLGVLFTHWIADSLTLWKTPTAVTDAHLWTAATYYAILANGPIASLYFVLTVAGVGAAALAWSLGDGQAVNLMFDGGSIFLYVTTLAMYLYSVLPKVAAQFRTIPLHQPSTPFPAILRTSTLALASDNLFASVALTGVLTLQAGRLWAESGEEEDIYEEMQEVEGEKLAKHKHKKKSAKHRKASGDASLATESQKDDVKS